ncbi:MAG: glycosyltransferase [Candidatus Freyarchaeota archaeon]|nr:glycosyltransferase [Candidatus Jordarchaeia archaeon]MBS7267539.1 glycosyltransferase [Candidatus Jordarchaeia archaeon]MBS7278397.1 glycosyltransferase [Candidatus Jordarchaeia archaeon]
MAMSVVILTFNRREHVVDTVESTLRQMFDGDYEVIVVDNWSEDGSYEELKSRFSRISNFRIVRPTQKIGIAAARNYGLQIAKGDIVAFIDDDCIANRSWLKEINSIFKDSSVGCVGGKIKLVMVGAKKPLWLGRDVYGILGVTNWGEKVRDIYFPIGGNLAIRRDLAQKIGGFKEQLGPCGVKVFGEEISISNRVRNSGFRVVYAPKAEVFHKIWKNRIEIEHLLRRAYMISVGDYYLYGRIPKKVLINLGILVASLYGYVAFWRPNLLIHLFYAAGYLVPSLTRKEPLKTLDSLINIWKRIKRRR